MLARVKVSKTQLKASGPKVIFVILLLISFRKPPPGLMTMSKFNITRAHSSLSAPGEPNFLQSTDSYFEQASKLTPEIPSDTLEIVK
jgi:hypothetical protein